MTLKFAKLFNKTSFFLTISIAVGIYIRLDQFSVQILIDDEWHAVHQLLNSSPSSIFSSFGHADYSIPLTLLYWFEAKLFGLSELLMRWPMLLFGLLTILVFPMYIYRQLVPSKAIVFSVLLSLSPLLTTYSRTARPYAITLFLVYFCIWVFYKYYLNIRNKTSTRFFYGFIYTTLASLAIWLHLIIVFFIIAPFVIEFTKLLFKQINNKKEKYLALLYLGIPTFLLMSLLVLPPLLQDYQSLLIKSGSNLPDFDTLLGAMYLWLGTTSGMVVVIAYSLALIGFPNLIQNFYILKSIIIGFTLTLLVIFVTQPAWIQHSLTFSRYLLPIIPLLLLSIANGIYIIYIKIIKTISSPIFVYAINMIFISGFILLFINYSPLKESTKYPNTNNLHSMYSFEYRNNKNKILNYMEERPISNFWSSLKEDSIYKIAVVPWFFESYDWDGPRWEKISKKIIVPGYTNNFCTENKKGEVPNNKRFQFSNVSYPGNPSDIIKRGIKYIVYQKKDRGEFGNFETNLNNCDNMLFKVYGKPIFEDNLIKVYLPLRNKS